MVIKTLIGKAQKVQSTVKAAYVRGSKRALNLIGEEIHGPTLGADFKKLYGALECAQIRMFNLEMQLKDARCDLQKIQESITDLVADHGVELTLGKDKESV